MASRVGVTNTRVFDMFVNSKEIVEAYRFAKVDAWYFHSLNRDEFVQFEENLEERVSSFARLINTPENATTFSQEWLGGWHLQPKGIKPKEKSTNAGDKFDDLALSSDPLENFAPDQTQEVSFRLVATPTPEFHLLSSLWLSKVGYLFDQKLPDQSYGNRLRRSMPGNPSVSGHFKYYVPNFKKWRMKAIDTVEKCLKKRGRDAVVVTADAKSFFHALSPDFLLDEQFLQRAGVHFTDKQRRLTRILVNAINTWAANTPLKTGLPVGLPASSVIANAAFLELDLKFKKNEKDVLSYGRYVDDMLIVLEGTRALRRKSAVWHRIKEIAGGLLTVDCENGTVKRVSYRPEYANTLTKSEIVFEGEKCKVFSLARKTGLHFTDILKKQIAEVSSEFRLLPQNVGNTIALQAKMPSLVTGSGESAENFRKIDNLRLRKSDFSGLLVEMELYAQALQIKEWSKPRREFFALCNQYVMDLPSFFDFADKLPRIISLAAMCGNFMQISAIIDSLRKVFQKISKVTNCTIAHPEGYRDSRLGESVGCEVKLGREQLKQYWLKPLCAEIHATIVSSFASPDGKANNEYYNNAYEKRRDAISKRLEIALPATSEIVKHVRTYLSHDLAHTRFIAHLYQKPFRPNSIHSQMGADEFWGHLGWNFRVQKSKLFDNKLVNSALFLSQSIERENLGNKWVPFALLLPTRPIKGDDLFWIRTPYNAITHGNDLVFPYRGYHPNLPSYNENPDKKTPSVSIENITLTNPKVALVSLRTEEKEVRAFFKGSSKYQPLKRLNSIVNIVNSILRKESVNYILFHELSIPHKWFLPIAKRCATSGVSVIAGVDYILDPSGKCCNQVWMSLAMKNAQEFPSVYFHVEDKEVLAYDELTSLNNWKMEPSGKCKRKHGVIEHGNFVFSILICSEITDIQNRNRLRGLVDALFILAWNQDHSSFSPIIESAALDLHAYIVQCNNNKYGDSRVRMPGKDPWNRDIVRIRGGEDPYYVTVTLKVNELRKFQRTFSEPKDSDMFKPLPQGYKDAMAEYRKVVH
jgi:hypothetical protein